MSKVPDVNNQLEFFMLPAPMAALIIGFIILGIIALLIKVPNTRHYFKPLFKVYYVIALTPVYIGAAVIYVVTIGKVNIIQKLKEVDFFEKFKKIYLQPKEIFEDMRVNPTNYYLWVGIFICGIVITIDYILIVTITEIFYNGNDSIIFGIVSDEGSSITNPIARWIFMSIIGNLVWWPTKFAIPVMANLTNKYDKLDEPDRPWYDKTRLTYIAWAYIITADAVWCLGMVLTLVVYLFIPTWEVLLFTWVCVMICGLIELGYQQYSLQGIFKLGWLKGFIIWLLSMIPFVITAFLLVQVLGSQINLLL